MKLHVLALGIATGIFLGVGIFVFDAYSILFGTGGNIGIIRWFVPGFDRNWAGAFIGLVVGFIEGFLVYSIFALLYNRIVRALGK